MPITYRRPGVYLEESLLVNTADTASTFTVACFVGVAGQGPILSPTRIDSWSDYVSTFGTFDPITPPAPATAKVQSYLPFAVYSFFQNGGRTAYIIRAASALVNEQGTASFIPVNNPGPVLAFNIRALSAGTWGNKLKYSLATQSTVGSGATAEDVYVIQVLLTNANGIDEVVETFSGLSTSGAIPGTRRVDSAINDQNSGSAYVRVDGVNQALPRQPAPTTGAPVALTGGVDPKIPDQSALTASAVYVGSVDGPVIVNIVGYHSDVSLIDTSSAASSYVSATVPSSTWPDRSDIFVVNDSAPPRLPGQTSSAYKSSITQLSANPGDSYCASYTPWIIVPHPSRVGATMSIPPGGGMMGVTARVDATVGVFRAPAGVIGGISNAVGVSTKFTDTEMGDLNASNVNVVRIVPGAGVCIMGARTRKTYGADRYISARRTLIFVKEVMKRSTQFAIFENNDQRLWSALSMSADRVLRPLWEAGGLKGTSTAQAYYIRCDDTINTPGVIAAGEVRMELGVALQYPAEFVIIRLTQFDRGTFTTEVQPNA